MLDITPFSLSGDSVPGSASPNRDKALPQLMLNDLDRIWLQALYDTSMTNRRPNLRTIKSQLKDQLPRSYDPANIPAILTFSNGEEISPLGIRALQGSDAVLQKMNVILCGIQEQLINDPEIKTLELADTARHIGLSSGETSFLFYLMTHYFRFLSSGGNRTQGHYGMEFFSIDDAAYKNLMACEDFVPVIRAALMTIQGQATVDTSLPAQTATDEDSAVAPGTTATQVLAIHFLLKQCGVNPIDKPTTDTRFMQFLTGRETNAKKIQSTTLYKNIVRPFKPNEKTLLKELKIIREYFDNIELHDIVHAIDHEINTCKQRG
jgi:hypothetical protein